MDVEGWVYDRYLIEAGAVDNEVAKKVQELNELAEIQMSTSKDGPKEIKYFNLRASEVVANLLPMFEEQKVFMKVYLKAGIEGMANDIEMQSKLGPIEQISSAKNLL